VGFEPTGTQHPKAFQELRIRPLCHPSMGRKTILSLALRRATFGGRPQLLALEVVLQALDPIICGEPGLASGFAPPLAVRATGGVGAEELDP
jgi:hypothetical protein